MLRLKYRFEEHVYFFGRVRVYIRYQRHLLAVSLRSATSPPQIFALSVERPQLYGPAGWCKAPIAHPCVSLLTRNNRRNLEAIDRPYGVSNSVNKAIASDSKVCPSAQKPCWVCLDFAQNQSLFWAIFVCRTGLRKIIQAINIITFAR